eukprot:TRINITY_DN3055_c0_g1_i1.p1 TRINITY_DN3055_c0_g1~~TRINITY_DN3055_c0_g1_i1.p1  ORF type:complete len:924 (+),score=285.24 TRINITY_DN3055_c0_g1_i1:65-2773(+)
MEVYLENQISNGLNVVKKILDTNRSPGLAGDVHHQYSDKYILAEVMTGAAMASKLATLERIGLTQDGLKQLKEWSKTKSVTLRLKATETCKFKEKKTREVEAATKNVTEVSGLGRMINITNKNVTTVTEYFWNITASYTLTAYCGNSPDDCVTFFTRDSATTIMTNSENTPHSAATSKPPLETNITWLLQSLNDNLQVHFSINRSDSACHTPRRNQDITEVLSGMHNLSSWADQIITYFRNHLWSIEQKVDLDLNTVNNTSNIFIPVLPLLENIKENTVKAIEGKATLVVPDDNKETLSLPASDLELFLKEERRALDEKSSDIEKVFPESKGLILRLDGLLVMTLKHAKGVVCTYQAAIDYLETLLRNQLISAIGKEVTSQDFGEYMRFHNRKLFKQEYQPTGFSYAIRRPDHYPEGILSIEESKPDGSMSDPVPTVVRCIPEDEKPMKFALSASATVSFTGKTFVHSYVGHRFSHEALSKLQVNGRARQFSGFILLVGRIGGPDLFMPSHAMIIQNKDDFKIPLILEEIPTPKEFQDAIESLSPEQQRFAKAYRSMQLESTLFAMCVVQIKPQLEKVLNLTPDSLTKEIKLTQDLLELFIKYQIPSDLLSYKCDMFIDPDDIPAKDKVNVVKTHVTAMQEMLKTSKEKEIEEVKMEYQMAHGGGLPPPPGGLPPPPPPQCASISMMQCAPLAMSAPMPKRALERRAVAPPPQQQQQQSPPPQQQQIQPKGAGETQASTPKERKEEEVEGTGFDISRIPHILEKKYSDLDEDSALRPTIINVGKTWTKESQEGLLSKPTTKTVNVDDQKKEKTAAFDLLDALTKSGVLDINDASLHVIVTATHCFDKTLMDTVIQKSINPIEKIERSTLIVSTTIHDKPSEELVKPAQMERVKTYSPKLFLQ